MPHRQLATAPRAAGSTPRRGRALDEFELIEAVRERLSRAGAPERVPGLVLGSGDDAAVSERSGLRATSVDALVEGVHFRIPPFTHEDVGHKALATALSDLAAMGATPCEAYVQVGLPPEHENGALALADGLGAVAAEHNVAVAGGDITRSLELFCAVTVIGEADRAGFVRRAGAQPGDVLALTGEVGGAAAGLLLLERPELSSAIDETTAAALCARQLRPRPLIVAGQRLAELGVNAMIDVSDGVAGDARHLATASGCAIEVDAERVPVQMGVAEVAQAGALEAADLALGGGEDYELLVALGPDQFDAASEALGELGVRLTEIGRARDGSGASISGADGAPVEVAGYDQLRPRQAPDDRT